MTKAELIERLERMDKMQEQRKMRNLLIDREETHGNYAMYCFHAQRLKQALRASTNWATLDAVAKETLDANMIKIARILVGNARFLDHWVDMAGYSTQAARHYGLEDGDEEKS